VTFLGVGNTSIVTGPATVLTKMLVPVIGVYCVRMGPSRYRLFANQVILRGTKFEDSQEISQLLAKDMETMIRRFPEQWAWNYKRWKGRDLSKEVDAIVETAI